MRKNSFARYRGFFVSTVGIVAILLLRALPVDSAPAAPTETSPNPPKGPALWVANRGNSFVSEFEGKELSGNDTQAPHRTLASADLSSPWAVIFDSRKNLWVSNVGNGELTMFTLKQLKNLKTKNDPTAAVIISGLNRPEGMVFDRKGNMWVANEGVLVKVCSNLRPLSWLLEAC